MGATWLGLFTVLGASIPSALAAYFSWMAQKASRSNSAALVTGNGKTVGEMVTEVHGKESVQATEYETDHTSV